MAVERAIPIAVLVVSANGLPHQYPALVAGVATTTVEMSATAVASLPGVPNMIASALMTAAEADLSALHNRPLVGKAWGLIQRIAMAAQRHSTGSHDTLSIAESEDGAILIEWMFDRRRIGFAIEVNPRESSWYYASAIGAGNALEHGHLDTANIDALVERVIHHAV